MRIAVVVPGGVDRSEELRVIPALLALIRRLCVHAEVHVIALQQETAAGQWPCAGAQVHNIGTSLTRVRAIGTILRLHRLAPFDLVQAIWSGSCGLIAVTAASLLRIPSLVHVAGGELVSMPDIGFGGMQTWRGRLRERWVLRRAGAVSAASRPVIDALAALGVAARRVPLGVDLTRWPGRVAVARDRSRPLRLIHVASLNRVKDQGVLLRALDVLVRSGCELTLDVIGVDTLHGELHSLAERLGLSARVRFRGFLTQMQLRPLMETADLMVHTSRYEAGPLVVLEAAIAGVATVGTAVGHIAEWAPQAALAVPVGDYRALAAAIRRLIDDDALRLRVAGAAAVLALREDADHTAACFMSMYGSLLK